MLFVNREIDCLVQDLWCIAQMTSPNYCDTGTSVVSGDWTSYTARGN